MTARRGHKIALEGEWDFTRRREIASLFESIDGRGPLLIDLTTLSYIDSTILHEIGRLRIKSAERSITLAGPNDHIRRVLQIVGFDRVFTVSQPPGKPR